MFEIFNNSGIEVLELDVLEKYVKYISMKLEIEDAIFNIIMVDDEKIQELNKNYRGKDSVTDVLSFPLTSEDGKTEINPDTNAVQLGDVVISLETAVKQAQNYGHSLEREIGFLTVHSMLHLLGYDHETSQLDQRIMREKEESVLEKLGISRDVTFVTTGDKE